MDYDDGSQETSAPLTEPIFFAINAFSVMIDCSRGGVLKQSSVFNMMRNCALMGINMMQLYTEDTYEMEGETFFGYLRGGYTRQELIHMDDYADALGIELVPCIQTLGHLGQMLQWPKYHIYRDTNEVLLANWDETYNLIERVRIASHLDFSECTLYS